MYVRSASPLSSHGGYSRSGWAMRAPGFGQITNQTAAQIANSGLTVTTNILKAIGTIGGPVGAIIASIGQLGVLLATVFKGCGNTCIQATQYANQVEPVLQQNLQTYISSPVRTTSMQAAAVNNYNTAIAALEQACGQAALGSAGTSCIDERVNANSCQWQASPGGWSGACPGTYAGFGAQGSGSTCVNWVVLYLDPIQNDPCVQPDSVLTSGSSSTSTSSTGTIFGIPTLYAAGGLLLAAFLLGGGE
jgi:hypothetical protein